MKINPLDAIAITVVLLFCIVFLLLPFPVQKIFPEKIEPKHEQYYKIIIGSNTYIENEKDMRFFNNIISFPDSNNPNMRIYATNYSIGIIK